jgi:hypothetical protein
VIGTLEKHPVFLASQTISKEPMIYQQRTPPGEKCGLTTTPRFLYGLQARKCAYNSARDRPSWLRISSTRLIPSLQATAAYCEEIT